MSESNPLFMLGLYIEALLTIADVIMSHPIYLIGIGVFVTGAVIGLGYRLIRG